MQTPTISPLTDIADSAEALTDPRHHSEPRTGWDANRHRTPIRPHVTVQPGLIQQLRDMAEPGSDGEPGGHGGASSVPVALDAVSLLASISFGAAYRCRAYRVSPRGTPEGDIRALVGVAPTLSPSAVRLLRGELRSWQHQAEVITHWKTPARELLAPCPECGARGTLLARPDPTAAWCTGCGIRWDAVTVELLARYVTACREQSAAAARKARTRAVLQRRQDAGAPC